MAPRHGCEMFSRPKFSPGRGGRHLRMSMVCGSSATMASAMLTSSLDSTNSETPRSCTAWKAPCVVLRPDYAKQSHRRALQALGRERSGPGLRAG